MLLLILEDNVSFGWFQDKVYSVTTNLYIKYST